MAAAPTEIGRCKCPVCDSKTARLRVSAKQLAYVTCNSCNMQTFARSDRSDALLRALHIPEPLEVVTEVAPALAAPPAAPTPAAPARAPAPKPTPAPEPAAPPPRMGWGLLGA